MVMFDVLADIFSVGRHGSRDGEEGQGVPQDGL